MNSYDLPTGSYDDILIRCGDRENKCAYLENAANCTCDSLVGGTEYKIKFITRKKNWNDSVFELAITQYTSNLFSLNYIFMLKINMILNILKVS